MNLRSRGLSISTSLSISWRTEMSGSLSISINNPQQSWGFDGEPPKAVMKDSGTRDWTSWGFELQVQLVHLLIRHFLVLDISAYHLLVPPNR
jgi:hypothetical protein